MARDFPGDAVGIQVPVGRIAASRTRWQTVLDAPAKPCLYRIHNSRPAGVDQPGNTMIVEVDGTKRPLTLSAGSRATCSASAFV